MESLKRTVFFNLCKKKLTLKSEISGVSVKGDPLNFHHLFEKSSHPEIQYSLKNIMVVTGDEHQCLNFDVEHYEKARERRKWIEENWDEVVEDSLKFENKLNGLLN